MYQPRPLDDKNLKCHICGRPAKWYDREFHSRYVLGEALCEKCNSRIYNFTDIFKDDTPLIIKDIKKED